MDMSDYNRRARYYWWLATVSGLGLIVIATIKVLRLPMVDLLELMALMGIVFVAAQRPAHIPGTQTWITPSELFVFLAALLWGAPAATLVAVTDGLAISRGTSKRLTSLLGGPAIVSIAIFTSASLFEFGLGALHRFGVYSTTWLLVMLLAFSLLYFALSSFLLAAHLAIKRRVSILKLWARHRSMSLTYLAAASAAWFVYMSIVQFGPGALLAATPVVTLILVSCHYYFKQAEERENAIRRISEIHLATVEALAIAIDAKDQITHDHVYRVQVYACGLGRYFGLTDPEIEALKAGALLHDVGKIAVPDYILNKPGKLTAAEFDKMKIHTVVGAQIMERINFPYPVVPIVRHHHERWDGNGYPDSLKGEKIPITARVLTVADCFDAVREDRQYRKGMTRDEACQYLSEAAGKQFDPRVVEAFLVNLPKFEKEIEAHKSTTQPLLTPTKQAGLSAKAMSAVPAAGLAQQEPEPPEYLAHIKSAHSEAASIFNISRIVTQSLDAESVFAQTANNMGPAIPFSTCVFYLKEEDGDWLRAAYVSGQNADKIRELRLKLGQGIAGWVVLNGRPMCNTDPMLDLDGFLGDNLDGYRTAIVHPLTRWNETIGALALYSTELMSYDTSHLQFVEWACLLTSAALHSASLRDPSKMTRAPNPRAA